MPKSMEGRKMDIMKRLSKSIQRSSMFTAFYKDVDGTTFPYISEDLSKILRDVDLHGMFMHISALESVFARL